MEFPNTQYLQAEFLEKEQLFLPYYSKESSQSGDHSKVNTVEPATTPRTLEEVINGKGSWQKTHREIEFIRVPRDADDIEPEEDHLDADAFELTQAILGDEARDGGAVAELVGSGDGESAAAVEGGGEGSRGLVDGVARDAFRKDADREVVRFEDLVGGLRGGRRDGRQDQHPSAPNPNRRRIHG